MISNIRKKLDLDKEIGDRALRNYQVARMSNLTYGWPTERVAAVCLYIACRMSETPEPYMLIDFADAVNTNVFKLAAIFLEYKTHINFGTEKIHLVDPCIFLRRYISLLKFGDDKSNKKIESTAIRLI